MSSQQTFTYSKSILETLEKGVKYVQWCRSDAFIVNFENIANLFQVFLLLILNREIFGGYHLLLSYKMCVKM